MFGECSAPKGDEESGRQRDDQPKSDLRKERHSQPSEQGEEGSSCETEHLLSLEASREGGQTTHRFRQPRRQRPGSAVGGKSKKYQKEEARSPGDRERQCDSLCSEPREENREAGEEKDPRCDFGDRPVAGIAKAVDAVGKHAPAGDEERREEEDLGDRSRVGEILAEEERDEIAHHELEDRDDQRRQPEPQEEEFPHGAACRVAVELGGDVRIRDHADGGCNYRGSCVKA